MASLFPANGAAGEWGGGGGGGDDPSSAEEGEGGRAAAAGLRESPVSDSGSRSSSPPPMEQFERAAQRVPALAGSASREQLLYLYARYKQVKCGSCNTPKPGFFDFEGKQKWEAWKALGDTSPEQAIREYVATVKKLDPTWNPQIAEKKGKEGKSWVWRPSCQLTVSRRNHQGRALLHWACDRGHKELASVLLQHTADVNSQEASDVSYGRTSLLVPVYSPSLYFGLKDPNESAWRVRKLILLYEQQHC
uniref:Acyl-CoA-binding domain-containing protein 6 n=1 Tax=Podarcis muralis TaxID=64176 RepID=A0A670I1T0_PODMU